VWRGWLGERDVYAGFQWGELYWQFDQSRPVGINPKGATIEGHSVDGVLPDDQRRSGPFTWPAPRENYVWEALQGATVAVMVMQRCRYPGPQVLGWSDSAHQRAVEWLYGPHFAPTGGDNHVNFPPEGDDLFLVPLLNRLYGTHHPVDADAQGGKGMAWTAWTHP
jgi:hypothetical protein